MKKWFFCGFTMLLSACFYGKKGELPLVAIQIQDRNGLTETVSARDRLEEYEKMDFLRSKPYNKVLRVYKSDGKNFAKITTYHPNGTVSQYLEVEEMRAFGAYREWYPNGQQKIEAFVIGGTADLSKGTQSDWLFDGKSSVWDEEGHLSAEILYEKGVLEGKSRYFYPRGGLAKEMYYKKNSLEGPSISYFPDGSIQEKTLYAKGLLHGLSLGFFPDGNPSFIEEYTEGLLTQGAYYNPSQELISEVEDGWGFQVTQQEKTVRFLAIQRGQPEGLVKEFNQKGDLRVIYRQKEGKKQGEEIAYFLPSEQESPSLAPLMKLSLQWNQDKIHGSVKTWYNNGQLQSQKEYCQNVPSGPSCAWYKNGSLMYIEEYEGGKLVKGLYYKNYQKDPVSHVENGKGTATLFDEEGIFLKKVVYDTGKPVD